MAVIRLGIVLAGDNDAIVFGHTLDSPLSPVLLLPIGNAAVARFVSYLGRDAEVNGVGLPVVWLGYVPDAHVIPEA